VADVSRLGLAPDAHLRCFQGCTKAAAGATATSCQQLQRRAQCVTKKCKNDRGYMATRQRDSEERCRGRCWSQAGGAALARTFRLPRRGSQPRRRWPAPRATSRPPASSWRPPGYAAPVTHATASSDQQRPDPCQHQSEVCMAHTLNPKPACVELAPARAAQLLMHAKA